MFQKLLLKDKLLNDYAEQAKSMKNEEIMNLPLPLWQREILSELRLKKLLKKAVDDIPVREIKPWEGVILETRIMTIDLWVKQPNKENLFEAGDFIGVTGDNIFWGYTYLTGCLNVDKVKENSSYYMDMDKDGYFEQYQQKLSGVSIECSEVSETELKYPLLSNYGVRINK
jgi:hypothetical protein